jgi:hypothetical protein
VHPASDVAQRHETEAIWPDAAEPGIRLLVML